MEAKTKNMVMLSGGKTILGAVLIVISALFGFSGCVDVECNEQAQLLERTGEALVGVGLGHKLQKLISALKAVAQIGIDLKAKPWPPSVD